MRDHPIPPVTEPLQYRAIGIVRGQYSPDDPDQFTRGHLLVSDGLELEAVVLGRVLTLMRRHLDMGKSHLWVVYPRCREADFLHLQIAGIWEPSTLGVGIRDAAHSNEVDELPEGDDYFSVRGELIYTRPDTNDLIVKVRQKARSDGKRPLPFKLQLKGHLSIENLRHFVSLGVRRLGQQLTVKTCEVIAPIPTRGGKRKGTRDSRNRMTEERPHKNR